MHNPLQPITEVWSEARRERANTRSFAVAVRRSFNAVTPSSFGQFLCKIAQKIHGQFLHQIRPNLLLLATKDAKIVDMWPNFGPHFSNVGPKIDFLAGVTAFRRRQGTEGNLSKVLSTNFFFGGGGPHLKTFLMRKKLFCLLSFIQHYNTPRRWFLLGASHLNGDILKKALHVPNCTD